MDGERSGAADPVDRDVAVEPAGSATRHTGLQSDADAGLPAATVVLGRDGRNGLELLLLKRASTTSFAADAWVFPGGRVEEADAAGQSLHGIDAARRAAVRETLEETGLQVDGDEFAVLSHWTPGPEAPKRYLTWLLFGPATVDADVTVDGHEIVAHVWITPAAALDEHRCRRMDLLPPTWMTLYQLSAYRNYAEAAAHITSNQPLHYTSHLTKSAGTRVILWPGDAGYDSRDADLPGPRHRLYLDIAGWRFEKFDELGTAPSYGGDGGQNR